MLSDAEKSPKSRGILDLDRRIKLIENYDRQFQKQKINLEEIIGKELWEKYMQAYDTIISEMDKAQAMMKEIKKKIKGDRGCSNSYKNTEERKLHNSLYFNNKAVDNIISCDDELKGRLKSIGKSTFIKYYKEFSNPSFDTGDVKRIMKENGEDWSTSSLDTKASGGRGIINRGLAKQALIVIANSNNIGAKIREQAKKLWISI